MRAIPALRKLYRLRQTLSGNLTTQAYHRISFLIARCRMCSDESVSFPFFIDTLTFSFLPFTSMLPPTANTPEKNPGRRQLRDIKGNLVYRDKDDTRVMLSHIAEYTSWDTTKLYLTFPLFIWRMRSWLHQSMKKGIWTSPDPTIVVPSGRRYPEYWPKYEDEPRPEPE